jgi:hypothetical protein
MLLRLRCPPSHTWTAGKSAELFSLETGGDSGLVLRTESGEVVIQPWIPLSGTYRKIL